MDEAPSLSSYLIFNTVAQAGNLSQAAKILTISQPAVSKSLSKLEDLLDVKLFIRNSRGVRLTNEGQVLFRHTSSAFDSLNKAQQSLKNISKESLGVLKLGSSHSLSHQFLAPQLKSFTGQYPNIRFDITLGENSEIFDLVEKSYLDAGFILKPASLHRLEYIEISTLTETYACSPLFSAAAVSDTTADQISENLLTLNNAETEIDFAVAGMGVIRTFKEFIKKPLEDGQLKELLSTHKPSTLSFGLIYNRPSLQQWEVEKLVNYFKN